MHVIKPFYETLLDQKALRKILQDAAKVTEEGEMDDIEPTLAIGFICDEAKRHEQSVCQLLSYIKAKNPERSANQAFYLALAEFISQNPYNARILLYLPFWVYEKMSSTTPGMRMLVRNQWNKLIKAGGREILLLLPWFWKYGYFSDVEVAGMLEWDSEKKVVSGFSTYFERLRVGGPTPGLEHLTAFYSENYDREPLDDEKIPPGEIWRVGGPLLKGSGAKSKNLPYQKWPIRVDGPAGDDPRLVDLTLGTVWMSDDDPAVVMGEQVRYALPYFQILRGSERRNTCMRELEKGALEHIFCCGGSPVPATGQVDWKEFFQQRRMQSFYNDGFREAATYQFLRRVFLPQIKAVS